MNVNNPRVSNCKGRDKIIKTGRMSAFTIPNMNAAKSTGTSPVTRTEGPMRYGMMRRTIALASHLIINVFLRNCNTSLAEASS